MLNRRVSEHEEVKKDTSTDLFKRAQESMEMAKKVAIAFQCSCRNIKEFFVSPETRNTNPETEITPATGTVL